MKIAAICDEDTAIGLQLAGIQEVFIPENDERELFREIIEREDIGILFLTEEIALRISRELKQYFLENREFPIVVEIPGKKRVTEYVDQISTLIRRAVGINIERRAL
ncbi:MAG TPA: V-type ATP synthase subunit F [Thermoplasmatales archaeon]|nr:V-type ATP synthase subunit F [Thermoplasmatales archaeon]